MAVSQGLRAVSLVAGANTNIYRMAVVNSSGQAVAAGAGVFADGVFLESVNSGSSVGLGLPDGAIVKMEAGAAIVAGANVASNASGKAVTATSGNAIMGRAIDAASGDGSIISVLFRYAGVVA